VRRKGGMSRIKAAFSQILGAQNQPQTVSVCNGQNECASIVLAKQKGARTICAPNKPDLLR